MIRAAAKQFADVQTKLFKDRYGRQVVDLLELPIKIVLCPFTLAFDVAGSAPRDFGIPKLDSDLYFAAIFAVATLGTYDVALELRRKVLCQRKCRTCNGWRALRCTMCKGAGTVHYRVKSLKSGQNATAEPVAEAIAENYVELIHLPAAINLPTPLPTKDCPSCDGTELGLPLSKSSWTDKDLKDPKKLLEMTTLLNAQRELAHKILDARREEKRQHFFMLKAYLQLLRWRHRNCWWWVICGRQGDSYMAIDDGNWLMADDEMIVAAMMTWWWSVVWQPTTVVWQPTTVNGGC